MKRLADFDLGQAPTIRAETVAMLAQGSFIEAGEAGESVVLLRDSGTGKTHLLIWMGVAACEAGRRVR